MKGLRAYDVLMAGQVPPWSEPPERGLDAFKEAFRGVPVFLADDAVPCYKATYEAQGNKIDLLDLPPIAPPFSKFIVEWEVKGEPIAVWEHTCVACIWSGFIADTQDQGKIGTLDLTCLTCAVFGGRNYVSFDCQFRALLNETGTVVDLSAARAKYIADDSWKHRGGIPLFMLGLLQAKNVGQREAMLPRALRRHSSPYGATAEHRHYVLDIPGASELRDYLRGPEDMSQKRLHLVRGHFADYTEGSGLFGKLHGKYYIAPHVRGSVARGIVTKDYRVVAD